MNTQEKVVATPDALVAASKDKTTRHIAVSGVPSAVPSFRLSPGQSLRGADEHSGIILIWDYPLLG